MSTNNGSLEKPSSITQNSGTADKQGLSDLCLLLCNASFKEQWHLLFSANILRQTKQKGLATFVESVVHHSNAVHSLPQNLVKSATPSGAYFTGNAFKHGLHYYLCSCSQINRFIVSNVTQPFSVGTFSSPTLCWLT
ncbi:Serine/threonine-protein phosphatase [Trichinella pseudospiralis]